MCRTVLCLVAALLLSVVGAAEPPMIPVGLDAYRLWERWPYQRIGERACMRSTYDRRGGNEGADASHFLYQLADDYNVTLDVAGPGILYFSRYNHWHGSPWNYTVDGVDHLVQDASTVKPAIPTSSIFLPANLFPSPLALTWAVTRGADLSWVPIPFEQSFRMAYSRTHYGTGYYIYHQFVRGARLSQPIRSWDATQPPSRDVLELIARSGTDLSPAHASGNWRSVSPRVAMSESPSGITQYHGHDWSVAKGQRVLLLETTNAPSMIRKLQFIVPRAQALAFGRARLRITWDGRSAPSIDAPVALFFGAGTLYNRDGRDYLVRAFPVFIRYGEKQVELACFFPMPFFKSARLELTGPPGESLDSIDWGLQLNRYTDPPNHVGYLHATYRDHPHPEPGQDLVLLDTRETEGGGDWSGSFIGTSFIFTHRNDLKTLEGDPRFFFDDSLTPQAQGTGTEEWCGGGDYWGGLNMTLPFAGHPVGAPTLQSARSEVDKIHSAYRFLLADLMPFGKNAVIRLEHGGENQSEEHYETLAYWYGAPGASLIKTDTLQIGDLASERSHRYVSPDASEPYAITARYEWGVDTLAGREVYPAHTDHGRKTTGTSEFNLRLDPKNYGVLLRRKLDYSFPNQRAEVFIAADSTSSTAETGAPVWQLAGIWYLAGANTCVYSNPKDELGATQHIVQTSNRRFRDDEFLVPRDLTEGRSAIRVRIRFTPVKIPLYPGQPLPELAWSEIRYDAYCFIMGEESY